MAHWVVRLKPRQPQRQIALRSRDDRLRRERRATPVPGERPAGVHSPPHSCLRLKTSLIMLASLSLIASASQAIGKGDEVRMVAPALKKYTQDTLGEVWKRPGLTVRDRSIVKPAEVSETMTHLAFYSGWANAMSAVAVAKDVFAARKIGADQLPEASPKPLALDEAAEAQRATRVSEQFGTVAPGVVHYTTDILFRDLWLRPDLAPRDRSLVTVSALIASGQVASDALPPQSGDG